VYILAQSLAVAHADTNVATGLAESGKLLDALVWFERVWSDPETTWPNPELLDPFITQVEEKWVEPGKRRHAALVELFEHLLADLEVVGAYVEEMDWETFEEAVEDGLESAGA
jgi:hypothetical protein